MCVFITSVPYLMRRDTAGNTRAVFLAPSARFDPSFIAISPRPQWMTAFKDRKDDHIGNKFTRVNRHRKHALRVNADRSRIMVCMRTLLLQVCQVSKLNGQQQTKRPAKPKSSSFETRVRSTCVLVFFLKKKKFVYPLVVRFFVFFRDTSLWAGTIYSSCTRDRF